MVAPFLFPVLSLETALMVVFTQFDQVIKILRHSEPLLFREFLGFCSAAGQFIVKVSEDRFRVAVKYLSATHIHQQNAVKLLQNGGIGLVDGAEDDLALFFQLCQKPRDVFGIFG